LIGDGVGGVGAVDVGAVLPQRVDEAVLREHARRRERERNMDREAGQRDGDDPRPDGSIARRVPGQNPHDEDRREREMDQYVVVVQKRDHGVALQGEALEPAFGEDVCSTLEIDDPPGVGERLVGVVAGEVSDLAVPEQDRDDQGDFTDGPRADCFHRPIMKGGARVSLIFG
jgi:hypothetical protein